MTQVTCALTSAASRQLSTMVESRPPERRSRTRWWQAAQACTEAFTVCLSSAAASSGCTSCGQDAKDVAFQSSFDDAGVGGRLTRSPGSTWVTP